MGNLGGKFLRTSFFLAFASAALILLSITASQWALWFSLALLIVSRARLQIPRIWLPLAFFIAGTLLSLVFSPEPLHGMPQIKKLAVFTMLVAIYSTFRDSAAARRLFLCWFAIGGAVSCFALVQFAERWRQSQQQHVPFYSFYVTQRITGTMSHWMTFAGQEMVVLLMLVAFLLFAPVRGKRAWALSFAGTMLLGVALLLNETRTVWLGVAAGGVWLLWWWKRWMAVAAPAVVLGAMWLAPGPVHERLVSIFKPQKNVDSNEFRRIARGTGLRMIRAHPLLGIGLDETKYHFLDYLPPDAPNPLPPGYYKHLHNVYLQYAAERGIPTLLMMLWLLVRVVWDFWQTLRKLPAGRSAERFLLQGGIATVIGIMLSGLYEVNLGDTEVLTAFLVVVACGYVAVRGFEDRANVSAAL
jgi:putative inorganic carbon (hco3(-)) transporter